MPDLVLMSPNRAESMYLANVRAIVRPRPGNVSNWYMTGW